MAKTFGRPRIQPMADEPPALPASLMLDRVVDQGLQVIADIVLRAGLQMRGNAPSLQPSVETAEEWNDQQPRLPASAQAFADVRIAIDDERSRVHGNRRALCRTENDFEILAKLLAEGKRRRSRRIRSRRIATELVKQKCPFAMAS